ncbi:MAG: undecaprenyl-diphosphate phosphatase [Bacillota bacterium]|nr:undecaprenyl-diphosphate phosphatase [Bacillota bacterium]
MAIIDFLKYILLGIVQGFTEVLPVSSSGHVQLFMVLLNVDITENLLFQIVVNTGSLIAFLAIFAKDIVQLAKDCFHFVFRPSRRETSREGFVFVLKLLLASIPAAIVGICFKDAIDEALETYGTLLSGIGLLLTGTILLLVSQLRIRHGKTDFTCKDAIAVGVAQAFALVPGLSRSGSTTAIALKRGIGLDTALRFSFMMYIPVSIGSLLFAIMDFAEEPGSLPGAVTLVSYGVALAAAMFATLIAYRLIFNAFRSGRLKLFSVYCFGVGLLSIVLFMVV